MIGSAPIDFTGVAQLYKRYRRQLNNCADQAWSSGAVLDGPRLAEFEENLAHKYKRGFAVGVGSATDALYFSLRASGLNSAHSVLCPAISYVATRNAIQRTGACVRFVDTNSQGNVGDFSSMPVPDAILYVNLYGNIADYNRLKKYCDKNNTILIEDAAQSQGAKIGDFPSGKLGNISVFSFDATKNMPAFGQAGAVLTDDREIYREIKSIRRHSNGQGYGYKSLIPESTAAQLNFLLSKFDYLQSLRQEIASEYQHRLPYTQFIKPAVDTVGSYHKLVILHSRRDQLQQWLKQHGVPTKIAYSKTLDTENVYKNAQRICDRNLALPIHPFLKSSQIKKVAKLINEFDRNV